MTSFELFVCVIGLAVPAGLFWVGFELRAIRKVHQARTKSGRMSAGEAESCLDTIARTISENNEVNATR